MKKIILILLASCIAVTAFSNEKQPLKFIEASELTLVGKLFPDTPNPYHRVDTVKYKGFTQNENSQLRQSSGISVAFRTDSKTISVKAEYGELFTNRSTPRISSQGFDLYARVDGEWVWAGANAHNTENPKILSKPIPLVENMDGKMREYLLYLPNFSEIRSLKIGVDEGAVIESTEIPFKGRVCMFGSSYTHGTSTSRSGMTYPAQLSRLTGYQILSLGCGGSSKLQPYFAEALADVDADVFIFDGFSNPKAPMIEARIHDFIKIIRSKHPSTPLVFLNTLYRARRHFNTSVEKVEKAKLEMAEKVMEECVKKYENVYWINSVNNLHEEFETTADGSHPSDYGYYLMAKSIQEPLVKILDEHVGENGGGLPSKWYFKKAKNGHLWKASWVEDHVLKATKFGKGSMRAFRADGSEMDRYDIVSNMPVAGPFRSGDYLQFEMPVEEVDAGTYIQFDAVVTAENGAPMDWQVEWFDAGKWVAGKKIRIYGPCTGPAHKYSTLYETFRISEDIKDGNVRVRLKALEGPVLKHEGEETAGLMILHHGYVGAYAQDLGNQVPRDTTKVLCLGNSFTYYYSTPSMLRELAWREGHFVDVYSGLKGGRCYADHLTLEMSQEMIAEGGYDYALLQDQSQTPGRLGQDRKANAKSLQDIIDLVAQIREKTPDCTPVLEWTWAYAKNDFGGFGSYEAFDKYNKKGTKIMVRSIDDAVMSPVGEAFRIVRSERPDINLLYTDNHHQSYYGAYMKSCVNYLILFGEPFGESPADCAVEPEIAAYLRSVAERVVLKKQ